MACAGTAAIPGLLWVIGRICMFTFYIRLFISFLGFLTVFLELSTVCRKFSHIIASIYVFILKHAVDVLATPFPVLNLISDMI